MGEALQTLAELLPTPRRLKPFQLATGPTLLMDDYKAVIETVKSALDTLAEMPARRKLVVLGEVFEPPEREEKVYRYIGQPLAEIAYLVIFVGAAHVFECLSQGALARGMDSLAISSARGSVLEASRLLREHLAPHDVVLVKGVGSQRLERIALILAGGGSEV